MSDNKIKTKMTEQMQALFSEQWNNGACLGYAIKALKNCDYSNVEIRDIVAEMKLLFERVSLESAENIYKNHY